MGKLVPYAYWVTYTLFVSIMVMNLVIAVILESYEEGKGEKETEILEYCLKVVAWVGQKSHDYVCIVRKVTIAGLCLAFPDVVRQQRTDFERLPMAEAVVYVTDAVKFGLELQSRQGEDVHARQVGPFELNFRKAAAVPKFGSAMTRITQVPMKFIRPMDLPVDAAGEVSFLSALLQASMVWDSHGSELGGVVGDTFAHLATLVDGGITTMSSGDNTGIQPPLTLPGSLTVSHGTNVINFAGKGVLPAVMGDAQLVAATATRGCLSRRYWSLETSK
ncbi:unnamed protein product, partial [Symbiodinium microadriaticum]